MAGLRHLLVAAAGLASTTVGAGLPWPANAAAAQACPAGAPAEAEFEVVAVAQDGPADPERGRLLSPATFTVEEWVEAADDDEPSPRRRGTTSSTTTTTAPPQPTEIRVETAVEVDGDLFRFDSEGIEPRAGERWRIRGRGDRTGVIETSVCLGSERLAARPAPEPAEAVDPTDPDGGEPDPSGVLLADGPPEPGDGRWLSLGVSAAGAAALAAALSRRRA